jgi:predicted house-cleaning noncanonical NTP pyrophosphatase (MazG superfamily)
MNKVIKYDKLVRDLVIEIIKKEGSIVKSHTAQSKEILWDYLRKKQKEESKELFRSPGIEELADNLEVLKAIAQFLEIDFKEVEKVRKKKAKERGSFSKGIILEEVIKKEDK